MNLLILGKKKKAKPIGEFFANRGYEAVNKAIRIGWDIERASATLERSQKKRTEVLNAALHGECPPGCKKRWLPMAEDILSRNSILLAVFSQAVESLLREGRGSTETSCVATSLQQDFSVEPPKHYMPYLH